MDQLTPGHPDVRWHPAALNAGWLSPTGYYWIPEACSHTSFDASGGGPCRHADSVALAAIPTCTWAVAILGTVPDGEGMAASLPLQYGTHRTWVHTVVAEVILHLLQHADRERATGVPRARQRRSTRCSCSGLRTARACAGTTSSTHSGLPGRSPTTETRCCTKRTGWHPSQIQLIIADHDGHLDLRPPTMQTLGAVAQQAQLNHALTHRGHTPLGTAHTTVHVHNQDLTAAATKHQALRARDGQIPVQRRLLIRKEILSDVAIPLQPCLLRGGQEETLVHMHVGCAHSRLLCPHYRQAVQGAA